MKRNICRCDENRMAYDPDVDNYWCEDHGHWLYDKPDVIVMPDGEWIPNYDKQAWVFVSRDQLPKDRKGIVEGFSGG